MKWALILCLPLAFWQCDNDDDAGTGQLRIELTDAPLDDTSVEGVFVTVTGVYLDGKLWEGTETKQTLDLTAFQKGNVYNLGIADVDARTYNRISLSIDLDEDANGNSPGCYVVTQGGEKHDLAASTASEMTIEITGAEVQVTDATTSTAIIDFDLRKALRYGNPNAPASDYAFGTQAEMNAALRFVSKQRAGSVKGHCTDLISTSDKIVVYAYHKGDYERTHEVSAAADEQFAHAVTSAAVDAQGDYTLSWLEEGDYTLVFSSYEDDGSNGTMDLQGTLNLDALLGIDLTSVAVGISSTVTVDVTVTGILPL